MKSKIVLLAALLPGSLLAQPAPDTISGSPKADFRANELTIPCVQVTGLDDATEGLFFDIRLKRRGQSFNYELSAVQAEDSAMCQAIADFAELEDEDYAEDGADDDGQDDADDGTEADDSSDDGAAS